MSKAKGKAKKLSRRQMVMLLGTGTVLAAPGGGHSAGAQGRLPCHPVKPIKGGSPQQTVLLADPCCQEGLKVFREGFKAIKDTAIKGHLQDFDTALGDNEVHLLEYCVMLWGLKQTERDVLVQDLRIKYQLKEMDK
jgi:hypothetical protein